MHMVAHWTWSGNDELCSICHNALDSCSKEDEEFPGDDSPVVWGKCKHAFHLPCIVEWLKKQQDQAQESCPLCRAPWEFGSSE